MLARQISRFYRCNCTSISRTIPTTIRPASFLDLRSYSSRTLRTFSFAKFRRWVAYENSQHVRVVEHFIFHSCHWKPKITTAVRQFSVPETGSDILFVHWHSWRAIRNIPRGVTARCGRREQRLKERLSREWFSRRRCPTSRPWS